MVCKWLDLDSSEGPADRSHPAFGTIQRKDAKGANVERNLMLESARTDSARELHLRTRQAESLAGHD